jgi:hypothetical protein
MLNMCAITPPGDCPPFISINYHDCVKDEPYEGELYTSEVQQCIVKTVTKFAGHRHILS